MGGKEGGYGAVGTPGKGASADPDDYYDVEADDEPCRLPGRTVLATVCLYLTFVAMGFGTGWSSIDSVFQELNKFIEKYDDLKFASDLVFASSCAASMVLVLAFLGLYCNPSKYDLRTLGFFEGTISTVLIVSCCVQFILMNFWQESRYVVLACSFMGATIGNIQGFIIYPFFNAFYRLELIAYMNMGETLTSMACGSLALLQSPTVGVENFTVSTYFTVLFYATCTAGAAWSSLGWQTGYRRDADEVDSPQDLSSTASPRVLSDDDTDHPERKPLLQKIESGGSEVGGGSGGEQVWTAGGVMTRGPHGMTTPAKEVRSARKQKPMQKLRGLYTNVVGTGGYASEEFVGDIGDELGADVDGAAGAPAVHSRRRLGIVRDGRPDQQGIHTHVHVALVDDSRHRAADGAQRRKDVGKPERRQNNRVLRHLPQPHVLHSRVLPGSGRALADALG